MGDFLEKAKKLRPDISDWVVHFTKGSPAEAREALKGIVAHGLENRKKSSAMARAPGQPVPIRLLANHLGVPIEKTVEDLGWGRLSRADCVVAHAHVVRLCQQYNRPLPA